MTDKIKELFIKKAVIYDNIWMFFISTAIEVVNACQENQKRIFTIEAFKLTGEGIQPSQEHSIHLDVDDDCWCKAIDFLTDVKDKTFLYEIWYEGY